MQPLDQDIHKAVALVVDGNPMSRSGLCAMLKDAGVAKVEACQSPSDAKRLLEMRPVDILLCDYHFPGHNTTGQDLIDDLRLGGVLPLETVVVMISGEAGYTHVVEAAEAALDAYLIKPHTVQALRERLQEARLRKRRLAPVFEKINAAAYAEAAELCDDMCTVRAPSWVHAARIGADLYLNLGQATAAMRLFDLVTQTRALPWARLGIAQSQFKAGSVQKARRTLETLLADQPGYVDAYDVMSRVLLDEGDNLGAVEATQRAVELTPGSVARLQKFGILSFYFGDQNAAADALLQASALGINSKSFDLQSLVILAVLQYDRQEPRQLALSRASMKRMLRDAPDSPRLQRFMAVIECLFSLQTRNVPNAVTLLHQLMSEVREPSFDFEAACNLLKVLMRVWSQETRMDGVVDAINSLARRFAVSRTTCDMLMSSAGYLPELVEPIRTAYQEVLDAAEAAVSKCLAGAPWEAVAALIEHAEATLNAKLLDLANNSLARHRAAIENAQRFSDRIERLRAGFHSYGTQVPMGGARGRARLSLLPVDA